MGTTTRTTPFEGDIGDATKRFLSYGELHERLYLSRTQTFRLEREGARLLPDVIVTPGTLGWDDARVLRYGVETKRLAQDGQPAGGWDGDRPRNRVEDGSLPEMRRLVEEKYSAPPRVYLGSAHCSYLYGLTDLAVLALRRRNAFIPASVRVGDKFLGWNELEVIKFGRQTGRLSDPATLRAWAVRRTEEFGLDPNTAWVVELLGEDALPEFKLRQAAGEEAVGDTPS
jgi:predicted DNA-binding transcriptional regulator AlpA